MTAGGGLSAAILVNNSERLELTLTSWSRISLSPFLPKRPSCTPVPGAWCGTSQHSIHPELDHWTGILPTDRASHSSSLREGRSRPGSLTTTSASSNSRCSTMITRRMSIRKSASHVITLVHISQRDKPLPWSSGIPLELQRDRRRPIPARERQLPEPYHMLIRSPFSHRFSTAANYYVIDCMGQRSLVYQY